MSDLDVAGLRRLVPYLNDATAAQPPRVADQLSAAVREGLTSLRFEQSAAGPVVVVEVGGLDLAEVSLDRLVDL